MREGDPWAWGEFVARFQPTLEVFARRVGIPPEDRAECVADVVTDEAMRFTAQGAPPLPENLSAYLMRAVRHKYLGLRRARTRRARHYADASDETGPGLPESVVRSACSAHMLRLVREPSGGATDGTGEGLEDATTTGIAVMRLAAALARVLSGTEVQLLAWQGEQLPHREIAAWLGVSYDAATKRLWRLARRSRALAATIVRDFPPAEQAALARLCGDPEDTMARGRTGRHQGGDGHE